MVSGRGYYPISPIFIRRVENIYRLRPSTNLSLLFLFLQRNMCTKFYKDILICTQVSACTERRTDRRTDFNLSRNPDYLYIHNPISIAISSR